MAQAWLTPEQTEMRSLIDWADETLGGTRADDNKSTSTLRLTGSDVFEHGFKSQPHFSSRFTLKLGVLERWQEEVNQEVKTEIKKVKEELLHKGKAEISHLEGEDGAIQKKVTAPIKRKDPWRFSLEKRIDVARKPDLSFGARVRRDFESRNFLTTFAAQAGWSWRSLWNGSAELVVHRQLAKRWTTNFSNNLTWQISKRDANSSHAINFVWLPKDHQVVVLSAGMGRSVTQHAWQPVDFNLAATYRLQTWRNRFFLTASPSLVFPKAKAYKGHEAISLAVELVL